MEREIIKAVKKILDDGGYEISHVKESKHNFTFFLKSNLVFLLSNDIIQILETCNNNAFVGLRGGHFVIGLCFE